MVRALHGHTVRTGGSEVPAGVCSVSKGSWPDKCCVPWRAFSAAGSVPRRTSLTPFQERLVLALHDWATWQE